MHKPLRDDPYSGGTIYNTVENYVGYSDFKRVIAISQNLGLLRVCSDNLHVFEDASKNCLKLTQVENLVNKIDPVLTDISTVNKLCSLAEKSDILMDKLGDVDYFINKFDDAHKSIDKIEKLVYSKEFNHALNSIKIFPTKTKRDLEYSITETAKNSLLKEIKPFVESVNNFSKVLAHITAVSEVYTAREYEAFDEKTIKLKVDLINQAYRSIEASEKLGNNEAILRNILESSMNVSLEDFGGELDV